MIELNFLERFFWEFYWEIVFLIIIGIVGLIIAFGRRKIRRWLYSRKVTPKFNDAIGIYEKEILPDSEIIKPKIKIIQKKEEIPADLPFGYIFVPEGEEELIWSTLITYIPISSSLRKIRILFDESLRRSLFDLLSYQLGMKLGKHEFAVTYRDNAFRKYKDDFLAMEKLYDDRRLTTVILLEASYRYRRCKGHITSSEIEEFSILVRKLAEVDANVFRIGNKSISGYVAKILESKRGAVLLAWGKNVERAIKVSEKLQENGFEVIPSTELGIENPQTGMWFFGTSSPIRSHRQLPFIRIWLSPSNVR